MFAPLLLAQVLLYKCFQALRLIPTILFEYIAIFNLSICCAQNAFYFPPRQSINMFLPFSRLKEESVPHVKRRLVIQPVHRIFRFLTNSILSMKKRAVSFLQYKGQTSKQSLFQKSSKTCIRDFKRNNGIKILIPAQFSYSRFSSFSLEYRRSLVYIKVQSRVTDRTFFEKHDQTGLYCTKRKNLTSLSAGVHFLI